MNLAFRDEVPPVPMSNRPRTNLSPKVLLLAGVGAVVLIFGILLVGLISGGDNLTPRLQRLSARLTTMQTMVKDAKEAISDPDLNKVNSDLRILTTGSISRLQAPLKAAGADKPGDDIKAAEADTATLKALADAKLAGTFDRTYARTIKLKLDTILALLNELYPKAKNASLREALSSVYKDFIAIRKQLDEKVNV